MPPEVVTVEWVGGPTPRRAAYVATPDDRIDALMVDLVDYANQPSHDPVTAAGLLHAQFETIHPFADGNGRIGRLLIGWTLHRHLALAVPPPVSVAFLRDVGGYLSGLTLYRTVGPDDWIRWFASTVEHAAMSATETLAAVSELVAAWSARLENLRSDAAARRPSCYWTSVMVSVGGCVAVVGLSTRKSTSVKGTSSDHGWW